MRERRSRWVMSRTSTPSSMTLPQLASWNRSASIAIVDLPEPVPPMIAVIWPLRQTKST